MSDFDRFDALRAEYEGRGLDGDLGDAPGPILDEWLAAASDAGLPLSNAMALATATADGVPSVRMVLLKKLDAEGRLWFFTDKSSRKGSELAVNKPVEALFYWQPLHRQIRIAGIAADLTDAEADAYFAVRPRASQLSAVASHQSAVIATRETIERDRAAAEREWRGRDVARPERWGGYAIRPTSVEFWQGRGDRLHHRVRFTRVDGGWQRAWLSP